jgi:uncharacterized protein YunC (DUF1805 family)
MLTLIGGERDNPEIDLRSVTIMKSVDVVVNGKTGIGVEIELPKASLVLVHGDSGFVMCGYLDIQAADKKGDAAALVRGVCTVNDLLEADIAAVTKAAAKKGVKIGMTGRDALSRLL